MEFSTGFWLIVLVCSVRSTVANEKQKVIYIYVDGCRWDYGDDPGLQGLQELARKGVRAKYVIPSFPASSLPNEYTLVTGLYPESHGIVHNLIYDQEAKEFFLMFPDPGAVNPRWWNSAEPIWVTAEKNGIRTGVYWWVMCQLVVRGVKPTECLDHRFGDGGDEIIQSTIDKFNDILEKFQNNQLSLALVYYGAVDKQGHIYGPDSPERKKALADIDRTFVELQNEIEKRGMQKEVNVVVVSDHGMTRTDPDSVTYIDLEPYAEDIQYMLYWGSSPTILPMPGKEDELYNNLKNITGMSVYKKEDIPERYHMKHNKLVLPLLLVAHKGYYIKKISDVNKTKSNSTGLNNGSHGYDPSLVEDMNTIFYARGPAVKEGYVSPPLENVDHYNLLCHILGLEPLPNNGSWDRIKDMLTAGCTTNGPSAVLLSLFVMVLFFLKED